MEIVLNVSKAIKYQTDYVLLRKIIVMFMDGLMGRIDGMLLLSLVVEKSVKFVMRVIILIQNILVNL